MSISYSDIRQIPLPNVDAKASLPRETWDTIIDHLFDDRASLKRCALVCRTWTSTARHHIFGSFTVSLNSRKNIKRATGLLIKTKEISPHIRNFRITNRHTIPLHRAVLRIGFLASLPTMPALKSLCMEGIHWNGLTGKAIKRLEALVLPIQSFELQSCVFANGNDTLRLIGIARHLNDLRIRDCTIPLPRTLREYNEVITNLTRLDIEDDDMTTINAWLCVCDIHTLVVFYTRAYPHPSIISLLSRNVVHLVLTPKPIHDSETSLVEVNHFKIKCTTLRQITLQDFTFHRTVFHNILMNIQSNSLEKVTLEMGVGATSPFHSMGEISVFSGGNPDLNAPHIKIHIMIPESQDEYPSFESMTEKAFQKDGIADRLEMSRFEDAYTMRRRRIMSNDQTT